jgi:cardiolipin synthase
MESTDGTTRIEATATAPPAREPSGREDDSHTITLLHDGEQAYSAWLEAIAGARHEVLFEMYWFASDRTGAKFAATLAERARAGVSVRVLFDGVGSLGTDAAQWDALRAAGAQVLEFHPVSPLAERFALAKVQQRDHRKILVIDGALGFTGGINVCDQNLPRAQGGQGWRDDAVRLTGEAVLELRALFFDTWMRAGGAPPVAGSIVGPRLRRALTAAARAQLDGTTDGGSFARAMDATLDLVRSASRRRRKGPAASKPSIEPSSTESVDPRGGPLRPRIIGHDSWTAARTIRNVYVRRIESARRVILIANSYFAPDVPVRRALVDAARRGVEVRVLVPRDSDVAAVAWAGRALYEGLLAAGVRVHEWTASMLHSKTAVIDGWATVGSYNFDYRSLRYNLEVTAACEAPDFVASVEASLRDDLAKSVEVDPARWRLRPWWHRLVERLFYLLRKVL